MALLGLTVTGEPMVGYKPSTNTVVDMSRNTIDSTYLVYIGLDIEGLLVVVAPKVANH